MPSLAVIQAPLGHAKSVHEPLSAPAFGVFLQQLSCFNMVVTARAQTKNNLYEHGVERGLGCSPGLSRRL